MFPESRIDSQTVQAYRETEYHVHREPPFTLRVGSPSPAILSAQRRHGAASSAFLTACNPYSEQVDNVENAGLQTSLAKELKRRGLAFLPG